ncbi:hypothetical protein F4778DRAFT_740680 [Xylariomycetidae sp. FL2044]|nr:hypothetical protein F4778DRAFT_740680 [Xylariomycetidae sp. FL2044]
MSTSAALRMEQSPTSGGNQPYGRACQNCVKSKCKCIPRPGGPGCERCYRVKKSCVPGESVRRRRAAGGAVANTRISKLEEKIDSLVTLMEHGRGSMISAAATSGSGLNPDPVTSSSSSRTTAAFGSSPGTPAVQPASSAPFGAVSEPAYDEAQDCVAVFRDQKLRFLPFVHLSDSLQWLHQERPFLLTCIIASCTKSTERKMTLHREIKQTLAQRLILDKTGTINIDLLLGTLVFVAWGNDQFVTGSVKSMSRLTQLAMTIVFELGLNKPPMTRTQTLSVKTLSDQDPASSPVVRSWEETRAVLGCFLISSIMSSYLGRIDAMQWTSYMSESLEVLSQHSDCPSDLILASQVRLELISREFENAKEANIPPAFYLKAFQSKLDNVKTRVPPHLLNDEIVLASVHSADLQAYDLFIAKKDSSIQGLEILYACLNSINVAVENIFKIPPVALTGLSFPFFTHMARCIMILYKLTTSSTEPILNESFVRSTVDVLAVMDKLIGNFQQTSSDEASSYISSNAVRVLDSIRSYMAANLDGGTRLEVPRPARENDATFEAMWPDGMYDMWMKDILTNESW